MFHKKLFMIFTICIVLFMVINAVSAVDDLTKDIGNVNDLNKKSNIVEDKNSNFITNEQCNHKMDLSKSDKLGYGLDDGSFKDLNDEITNANGELNLTRDYVFDSSIDSTNPINIDKTIIINGNGHNLLAESQAGIFNIVASNVILKNINFYDYSKGCIKWQGANGTLINCNFENCKNTDNRGLIYWINHDSELISDCTFKKCSSNGGLLYLDYSNIKIENTNFIQNTGSSVFAIGNSGFEINNSTFNNNKGTIVHGGSSNTLGSINNSKFYNNLGLVINFYGNNFEIDNSIFINNTRDVVRNFGEYTPINYNNNKLNVKGGAIYIGGNYSRISNSVFKNNTVSATINSYVNKYWDATFKQWNYFNIRERFYINAYGGAIAIDGNKFYLNNISCENNQAYSAGHVDILYTSIPYSMSDISLYQYIYTATYGGAIYLNGGGILSNSFISNSKLGGDAYVNRGIIEPAACPIICDVKGYGVGVYWEGYSRNNLVNNTIFLQNNLSSDQVGSALYLSNFKGNVNFNTFLQNPDKIIYSKSSEISADYNWWGNTASNFNQKLFDDDLDVSKWFFLNISSTNSNLQIGEKSIITLDLTNVYDSSSNTISHSNNLNNINFNLINNKIKTNVSDAIINEGISNVEVLAQNYGQGLLSVSYKGIILSTLSFNISKKSSQIKSQINNCTIYKDELIAYLNITPNATGTLTIYLNNNLHSSINLNGNNMVNIDLTGLSPNNYTLFAVYSGDENYFNSSDSIKFEVKKAHNTIQITNPYAVDYGDIITLIVDRGNVTDGNLFIQIKNNSDVLVYNHTYNIMDVTQINLPVLDAGNYCLSINYASNNYYGSNFESTFTINKLNPIINKQIINTVYGKSEIMFNSSVEGLLKINILNNTYKTLSIESNINTCLNLSDINAGDHELEFVFIPNDKNYNNAISKITLTIFKAEPTFNIVIDDINYKESAKLNINYLNGLTGIANITISNEKGIVVRYSNVNLNGNNFNKTLNDLNVSKYTISFEYGGNNNYYSTALSKTFNVFKIDPIIMVDVTNALYGQTAKIIVNSNAEGNVSIKIGSIRTYEELLINDKRVSQNIIDIDAGTYDVEVTYNGNHNYNSKTVNKQLIISKVSTTIIATVNDIIYSETAIINVKSSIDGEITVKVNENYIKTVNIVANTITPVNFNNIPAGKHNISVVLNPSNKNYIPSSFNTDFTVSKKQTSVTLAVEDSIYGNDVIINVTSSEDGKVTLCVGDITREKTVLANTLTKFNLGVLAADSYNIEVIFDAGSNYKTSNSRDNILVSPAKSDFISIETQDNTYGENTIIKVKTNVDGVLTVNIGNILKTFDIFANKFTSFDLGKFDAETYTITMSLDAGSNYTKSTNTTKITVNPKATTLDVGVKNSVYGEEVIINVTASNDGKIAIKMGNIVKTIDIKSNEVISVNMGIFDVKSYNVNVTFDGDNNYKSCFTNEIIIISQAKALITDVEIDNITYGDNTIVKIKTNVDGFLTVKLGEITKSMYINANELTPIDFGVLDANIYSVIISLNAGDNYLSDDKHQSITVYPKPTNVILSVKNYVYGENIIVDIFSSEKGNITINLGNIVKNINVDSNKMIHVDFGVLDADDYNVNVNLDLGENYISSYKNASFTVYPKPTDVILSVKDYFYGENVVVNVSSTERGKVTIKLGDIVKNIDVDSNKIVYVDFGVLNADNYNVNVSLDLGENYIPSYKNVSFSVYPKATSVSLMVREYLVGENVVVNVSATEKGKIVIYMAKNNDSIVKIIDVDANKMVSVDMGMLSKGLYFMDVNFTAGSNYESSRKSDVIKVLSKIDDDDINISIPEIIADQENKIIINLPSDATGTVTLNIGDNSYQFNVKNGIATVTVPKLEDGNYDYIISYSGDNNYSSYNTSGNIEVYKPTPEIIIPPLDNPSADGSITINLPKGATGTITLVIDKKPYSFPVNNGVAKIYVPDLTNGEYPYTITYSGDEKYAPYTETGSLTINKPVPHVDPAPTILTLKNIKVKRSAKKLALQATLMEGNSLLNGKIITFKFNGVKYKAKTNAKGIAKLTIKSNVLKKLKVGKKVKYQASYGKLVVKKSAKVKK